MCVLRKKGVILKYSVIREVNIIYSLPTPGQEYSATEPAPAPPSRSGWTGGREGSAPECPRPRTPRAPPVRRAGSPEATSFRRPPLLPGSLGFSRPSPAGRAPSSGTSGSRGGSAVRPGRNTPRLMAAEGSRARGPHYRPPAPSITSPSGSTAGPTTPHDTDSPLLLLPAMAPRPLRDTPAAPLRSPSRWPPRLSVPAPGAAIGEAAAGRPRAARWPRPVPPRPASAGAMPAGSGRGRAAAQSRRGRPCRAHGSEGARGARGAGERRAAAPAGERRRGTLGARLCSRSRRLLKPDPPQPAPAALIMH